MEEKPYNLKLKGIPASEGIIAGPAYVLRTPLSPIPKRKLSEAEIEAEVNRLEQAVSEIIRELEELKQELDKHKHHEPFLIVDAHLLIMQDQTLWQEVKEKICSEQINCEWAIRKVIDNWLKVFVSLRDPYLRERGKDIELVGQRILDKLVGHKELDFSQITEPVVIVAPDLRPDQTARMIFSKVLGFATDVGSRTSHTAIVARSLEIPAVVGLERITELVEDGDIIIVDGGAGEVIINPDPDFCARYQERRAELENIRVYLQEYAFPPSVTKDGKEIQLSANLEVLAEINFLKKYGAEGVGLYRTEYLYLNRERLPDEEDHFENYRKLAEAVAPYQATIRTFDLGGDKFASQLELAEEMNPALGLRAIRFCLKSPEIFKAQLRGILRASAFGKIEIMFPLISGLEEVREAKRILQEVMEELDREGVKFNPKIPVGIMIEVPSAVMLADQLAEEVDFFSIGTNDLIQYVLAIDRVNEYVSYLYQPLHPSILKMVKHTVDCAHQAGIRVAMCGEMAGDVFYLPVLVGLGLDQLSMPARLIPRVRKVLRGLKAQELEPMVEELLKFSTAEEVKKFLQSQIEKEWKELYSFEIKKSSGQDTKFICQRENQA